MYLPDCYSMRFTTLSNYRLIDSRCDVNLCLFTFDLILCFCYCNLRRETSGLELASTIALVLQANRSAKCAIQPNLILFWDRYNVLIKLTLPLYFIDRNRQEEKIPRNKSREHFDENSRHLILARIKFDEIYELNFPWKLSFTRFAILNSRDF